MRLIFSPSARVRERCPSRFGFGSGVGAGFIAAIWSAFTFDLGIAGFEARSAAEFPGGGGVAVREFALADSAAFAADFESSTRGAAASLAALGTGSPGVPLSELALILGGQKAGCWRLHDPNHVQAIAPFYLQAIRDGRLITSRMGNGLAYDAFLQTILQASETNATAFAAAGSGDTELDQSAAELGGDKPVFGLPDRFSQGFIGQSFLSRETRKCVRFKYLHHPRAINYRALLYRTQGAQM